jgi:hypothetical protein
VSSLERFFHDYRDSWPRGAGAIAQFYHEPCFSARAGVVRLYPTREDLRRFFEEVDRQYGDRGFHHGVMLSRQFHELGANAALATIRWAYQDAADKTQWESTFSYQLYKREGQWKILVHTMHD